MFCPWYAGRHKKARKQNGERFSLRAFYGHRYGVCSV